MGQPEKSGGRKKSIKLCDGKRAANIKTEKEAQSPPSKSPSGQQKLCKTQSTASTCRSPTQKSRKILVSPSKGAPVPPDGAVLKRSPGKAKEELAPTEPFKSVRRKESPVKQQVTAARTHEKSPGVEMHGSTFVNKINRGGRTLTQALQCVYFKIK